MKYHIYRCLWTQLYVTTLLGGEFDNCHGQGPSQNDAVASLKMTVNVRRRQKQRTENANAQTTDR